MGEDTGLPEGILERTSVQGRLEVQEKEPREPLLRVKGLQGEEAGSGFKFSVRSLLVLEGS